MVGIVVGVAVGLWVGFAGGESFFQDLNEEEGTYHEGSWVGEGVGLFVGVFVAEIGVSLAETEMVFPSVTNTSGIAQSW